MFALTLLQRELNWLVLEESLLEGTERYPWHDDVLGPSNSPWLIDCLIRTRELPDDMDTEGNVSQIREALRRTASGDDTMLDVALHPKLCNRTLIMWASDDGADREVGMAATATFPNMVFSECDECYSTVKSWMHSVEAVSEATSVDKQAARIRPRSFQSRAMQRHTSRSRPLTRIARRFDSIRTTQ